MKRTFFFMLLFSLSFSAFSYNADPIKKKAALVKMINKTLTETQAILLQDALLKLSVKDLKEIYDKKRDYQEIIHGLETRQPDDGDEHTTGSLGK